MSELAGAQPTGPLAAAWAPVRSAMIALYRLPLWVQLLVVATLALLVPIFDVRVWTSVGASVLTFAMLGLGLNIVVGYAGLLDLGYSAFFAIGAYTTAILTVKLHQDFWSTLIPAVVFAGLAGAILGYPTLRLRGDYLAIVTLGFGEIVRILFQNWDYVDGPNGIWNIPSPQFGGRDLTAIVNPVFSTVTGHDFTSQHAFYIIGLALCLLALLATHNLAGSGLGRGWVAVREDEFAAEAVGVPTLRLKLLAYTMGGMWAGLAGAFFASRVSAINPSSFTFQLSVTILIVVVLGGMGSIPGVILGALIVVALPEMLQALVQNFSGDPRFSAVRFLIYAIAIAVMMVVRPQGLWPAIRRRAEPFQHIPKEAVVEYRPGVEARVEDGEPLLRLDRISRNFGGVRAVDEVSLEVRRGEIFSIIGPNGAGKTTLFNCITGVLRPSSGTIEFNGAASRRGLQPHVYVRRGMARTFQGIRLFKLMAVYENVMVGHSAREHDWPWQAMLRSPGERRIEYRAELEARHWLRFMGIESEAGKLATELSYADQRRVEMARALASRPLLVLLDEPAAGMNPTEKAELVKTVRAIRALGVTVVLIDHDMSLVMNVSDRVAVLDQGRLIALGGPAEVQANPQVIEAYLGRDDDEQIEEAV